MLSGGTLLNAGALRICGDAEHGYRGNIRINAKASLEFGAGQQQILHGAISGDGALTLLPGATVVLRGSLRCALRLYEGSAFVVPPDAPAAGVDISRLSVRGSMVSWQGGLCLGAGKVLEFYVPDTVTHGEAMFTLGRRFSLAGGCLADIGGSRLTIKITGGPLALRSGEAVTLIDSRAGRLASDHDGREITATDDIGIQYVFRLSSDNRRLTATVISRS